ncbi:MAG: threonine/homoserine/homoserine lactone efflux protein [Bacteroidia bacterium]|jgi:threonine/homoserine/homoserine lactone efflux protein
MAILKGFILGLGMVVFIGPVLFTLLKSTLQYGFGAGMSVAWGIFISDVVCMGLCAFGAVKFFENPENQIWLAVGGTVILLGLGLKYIIKPNVDVDKMVKLSAGDYSKHFAKGFLVNFVNPFVFLVWIGVIGYAQTEYGTGEEMYGFLGASLLGILTTDSLKVVFADRVKNLLKPAVLIKLYRGVGVLLVAFAGRLIWFLIQTI